MAEAELEGLEEGEPVLSVVAVAAFAGMHEGAVGGAEEGVDLGGGAPGDEGAVGVGPGVLHGVGCQEDAGGDEGFEGVEVEGEGVDVPGVGGEAGGEPVGEGGGDDVDGFDVAVALPEAAAEEAVTACATAAGAVGVDDGVALVVGACAEGDLAAAGVPCGDEAPGVGVGGGQEVVDDAVLHPRPHGDRAPGVTGVGLGEGAVESFGTVSGPLLAFEFGDRVAVLDDEGLLDGAVVVAGELVPDDDGDGAVDRRADNPELHGERGLLRDREFDGVDNHGVLGEDLGRGHGACDAGGWRWDGAKHVRGEEVLERFTVRAPFGGGADG